jgi:hypothetical protein
MDLSAPLSRVRGLRWNTALLPAAQLARMQSVDVCMRHLVEVRRRGWAFVVGLLIIGSVLVTAGSAVGATAAPRGALTALTGTGSCLGGPGCAPLRGFTVTAAAATTQTPGVSYSILELTAVDGGDTMYVTHGVYTPWAIAVLSRNPSTGALSQLAGKRGCITTHRMQGCAFAPPGPHTNDLVISPDGKRVAVESFKSGRESYLLLSRDAATGALRRLGGWRGCVALIDGACGQIHGLRVKNQMSLLTEAPYSSYPLRSSARIIAGHDDGAPGGQGIAVQRRNAHGQWHEVPGASGCTNWRGTPGCHKLACLQGPVSEAVAGTGGHVYVIGGENDTGYVATFRRTGSGGVQPLGCTTFAPHDPTGKPIWLQPLTHSSTVLLAAHYFDHETPLDREQIYASTPGKNGALTRPRAISGPLAFAAGDVPALSPDGKTDYLFGNGGLYVYGVTSTAVTALPAPWFNPYSTPVATNGEHDNGVNDTPVVSPDGRFVYTVTGPFQNPSSTNQPEVRAYAVQP